ncbi:MAG: metallophosphoesterase [Candidatus Marinimicrobia bacterium]|nr:metallophosphoesterase [Candidatus Neomarinimicrobiota bacterium]
MIRKAVFVFLFIPLFLMGENLHGHLPKLPGTPVSGRTHRIVTDGPEIDIVRNDEDGRLARIRFTTLIPSPAVRVYYGIIIPDDLLQAPRYRWSATEKSDTISTQHTVYLNLENLFSKYADIDSIFRKHDGGVVVYRLEIRNPGTASAHYYDNRFRFKGNERIACISEGPFIDLVKTNSAVFSWKTDYPAVSALYVDGKRYVAKSTPNTEHQVRVTGLKGTEHRYDIEITYHNISYRTPTRPFSTPDNNNHVLFAVMSDSRAAAGGGASDYNAVNIDALSALLNHAYFRGSEFVLFSGDLIGGFCSDPDDYRSQMKSWKTITAQTGSMIPVYEGMGNHDVSIDIYRNEKGYRYYLDKKGNENSEALFAEAFVNPEDAYPAPEHPEAPSYRENVYFFDRENIRIISVNTNYWYSSRPEEIGGNLIGYIMDKQLAWVDSIVADADKNPEIDHIFLFAHSPAFPTGGHVSSGMWWSGGDSLKNRYSDGTPLDRSYVVKRRNEFWKTIASSSKTRAVFFGDEHNYSRLLVDKDFPANPDGSPADFKHPVYQIITGGAGAPFYAKDPGTPWHDQVGAFSGLKHYILVETHKKSAWIYVYAKSGQLIEKLQIAQNGNTICRETMRPAPTRIGHF